MTIRFTIKGGRKFVNKYNELLVTYNSIPEKTVKEGFAYALKIAPDARKNGDPMGGGTKQALFKQELPASSRGTRGKLVLIQPTKRPGERPYHMWMHGLGKYNIAPYITSGDPHFMETTAEFMKRDALKRARKK